MVRTLIYTRPLPSPSTPSRSSSIQLTYKELVVFFNEIFTGVGFELDDFQQDPGDECVAEFPSDP